MSDWSTTPTAELEGPCVEVGGLMPGDPVSMRAAAARLLRVMDGAGRMGDLLRRVHAGEWLGESGSAFREAMGQMPAPYARAAQAFGDVGGALNQLATALERGKETARVQAGRYADAEFESGRWRQDNLEWEASGRDAQVHLARTGRFPPDCVDPGEWQRHDARRLLAEAQEEVRIVEERTERTIRAATEQAPRSAEWGDFARGVQLGITSPFVSGYGLSPLSDEAGANWRTLVGPATDPLGMVQANVDALIDNPALYAGSAVPGMLLGGSQALRPVQRAPNGDPMGPGLMLDLEVTPQTLPQWVRDNVPQHMRDSVWASAEAAKIAAHSWPKHGVQRNEFPWVPGEAGLRDYVSAIIRGPDESFTALPGRRLYWDAAHGVMVIQQDDHSGTVYPCKKSHYDKQVSKAMQLLAKQQQEGTPGD